MDSDQLVMIAAGKVRAADRALEQNIADKGELPTGMEEHHMAGGVTGAVTHPQFGLAKADGVAILQPAVRPAVLAAGNAVAAPLLGNRIEEERVVLMWPFYRNGPTAGERRRPAGMIEMTVGEEDFFHPDVLLGNGFFYFGEIAAGVHDRSLHGFCAPQDRTVLLERRHRDEKEFEGCFGHRNIAEDGRRLI